MLRLIGISVLCMSLMSCLFVVDSKQNARRTQWHQDEVARIVVGETTSSWVQQTFGRPYRTSSYDNGTEVWRYRNTRSSESEVGLFLLFRIDVEREEEETLALEFRDGIVSNHWIDRH